MKWLKKLLNHILTYKKNLIWADFPRTDILPIFVNSKTLLDHRGPTEWHERTVDTEVQNMDRFLTYIYWDLSILKKILEEKIIHYLDLHEQFAFKVSVKNIKIGHKFDRICEGSTFLISLKYKLWPYPTDLPP